MISAVEALGLPVLTDEERAGADKLEAQIEEQVRKNMTTGGIMLKTNVTANNVIGEVNMRLRAVGWGTAWQPLVEEHALNKAIKNHVGFALNLFPGDEACREYARKNRPTLLCGNPQHPEFLAATCREKPDAA